MQALIGGGADASSLAELMTHHVGEMTRGGATSGSADGITWQVISPQEMQAARGGGGGGGPAVGGGAAAGGGAGEGPGRVFSPDPMLESMSFDVRPAPAMPSGRHIPAVPPPPLARLPVRRAGSTASATGAYGRLRQAAAAAAAVRAAAREEPAWPEDTAVRARPAPTMSTMSSQGPGFARRSHAVRADHRAVSVQDNSLSRDERRRRTLRDFGDTLRGIMGNMQERRAAQEARRQQRAADEQQQRELSAHRRGSGNGDQSRSEPGDNNASDSNSNNGGPADA